MKRLKSAPEIIKYEKPSEWALETQIATAPKKDKNQTKRAAAKKEEKAKAKLHIRHTLLQIKLKNLENVAPQKYCDSNYALPKFPDQKPLSKETSEACVPPTKVARDLMSRIVIKENPRKTKYRVKDPEEKRKISDKFNDYLGPLFPKSENNRRYKIWTRNPPKPKKQVVPCGLLIAKPKKEEK